MGPADGWTAELAVRKVKLTNLGAKTKKVKKVILHAKAKKKHNN